MGEREDLPITTTTQFIISKVYHVLSETIEQSHQSRRHILIS